ncbi:IPP, partial [Cordylochernes scorpioides]
MRNFSDTGESKENSLHQVRRIKEYEESFHHARLGTHTRKLWLQKHYMDIHILVQGRTFPAHKAVLTCYCPFLKKQLLSPTRFNVKTVELHNITELAFEVLLSYMYTGDLNLSINNVGEVYKASRMLEMKEASNKCVQILSGGLGRLVSTLYLYVTARNLNVTHVWKQAFSVLVERFEELVLVPEFVELRPDLVCELLSANPIGAR